MAQSHQRVLSDALAAHAHKAGALLPILHTIQDELGYIPAALIEPLSRAVQRSRAEIHGVISFYTYFRTSPPPTTAIELCRAEACQARGANALLQYAETFSLQPQQVEIKPVYCLGLCAQGPAAMVNDQPIAHLNAERLEKLLS